MNSVGLIESRGLVALLEATDFILKNSPVKIIGIKTLKNGLLTLAVTGQPEYLKAAVESAVEAGRRVGEIYASSIIENPTEKLLDLFDEIFDKNISNNEKKEFIESDSLQFKNGQAASKPSLNKMSQVEKNVVEGEKKIKETNLKIRPKEKIFSRPEKIEKMQPTEETIKIENPASTTIERLRKEALGQISSYQNENKQQKIIVDSGTEPNKNKIDFDAIAKMNVHKLRHYAREFENFPIKGREISRANRNELVELFNKMK